MTSLLGLEEDVTHIAQGQGVTAEKDNLFTVPLGDLIFRDKQRMALQLSHRWVVAD